MRQNYAFVDRAGRLFGDKLQLCTCLFAVISALTRKVVDWCLKHCAGKRVFIWRQQTLKSIYGIPWRIDFTVWDENLWARGLFIEAKSQSTSGSVDEKLPFVIASLKNNPLSFRASCLKERASATPQSNGRLSSKRTSFASGQTRLECGPISRQGKSSKNERGKQ